MTSIERIARGPTVRLAIYYVLVVLAAVALVRVFPDIREALVEPSLSALDEAAGFISGPAPGLPPVPVSAPPVEPYHRALTTFFVVLGAIVLAAPIAWVYMWTKRLRYDPGLVRSIIILPIAVSGILIVVKNSLAVAFSLAGIVAAVRFRNTLKDPQDAVYVFLTIAIGISAGVQALDVALVVSIVFNVVVITMWKRQVGSLNGDSYSRAGTLAIGDSALLVARTAESCRAIRRAAHDRAQQFDADGVLLVHYGDADPAGHAVQDTLSETAQDWRFLGLVPRDDGVATAEYLIALAPTISPVDLMGELDEWSAHFQAAEYLPFRHRRKPRDPSLGPPNDAGDR